MGVNSEVALGTVNKKAVRRALNEAQTSLVQIEKLMVKSGIAVGGTWKSLQHKNSIARLTKADVTNFATLINSVRNDSKLAKNKNKTGKTVEVAGTSFADLIKSLKTANTVDVK